MPSRSFLACFIALALAAYVASAKAHALRAGEPITLCYNPATYGINGVYMSLVDDKLRNPVNFGPAGKVGTTINVVQVLKPLTVTRLLTAGCDVFQIGLEENDSRSGTTFSTLSATDVQAIKQWSQLDNSKVVIGAQGYITAWGNYFSQTGTMNPMKATDIGKTVAFDGPFGKVLTNFTQGGSWQGVIVPSPAANYCTIIEDSAASPRPVAIVDIPTGDIFFSDVDILSILGGVTDSPNIVSNNDIVLANLHALIIKIVEHAPANVCTCTACGLGPIVALSGNLAFGSVAVGSAATRTVTISNTGSGPLSVTSISYPVGFSGTWSGGTIAPGGSQQVLVTFTAASRGSYGGPIMVNGNQIGGTNTIRASGTGVGISGDVNDDGLPDLIWRNYTTGANVVWNLNGPSLISQANLSSVTDLAWQLAASADVNGDGRLDMLWRNGATGANVVWYLNSTTLVGQANLPAVTDLAWQIVASADVNRDGSPDLIWRHTTSGANVVWYLKGTTIIDAGNFPSVTDLTWQIMASADVNHDGSPDLIWRNSLSGANLIWYLDGTALLSQANLPSVVDLTWQLAAAFDVNRDQAPDLIWRNTITGDNIVWYLSGTTLIGTANLPKVADLAWRLMGAVLPRVSTDINGDRHPDLVWRNTATGANAVWYLNGTSLTGQASLTSVSDLAWQIAAITDVNGDTHPDLVWRNGATGANIVWYVRGTTVLSQGSLPSVPDPTWRIVAAADLNGDTHADLIWRNTVSGTNVVWYLNGATLIRQASLPSVADLAWQLVASADINRDTHPDLVWRNVVTGANVVWYLDGTSLISQALLSTVADSAWKIAGAADIDGDGHPDLIWRNMTTGANAVWYLNGTTLISQASLPSLADTNWALRVGG